MPSSGTSFFMHKNVAEKAFALVAMAIVVFLTFTAYSVYRSVQSNHELAAVKNLYFPVLERLDANIVRLGKIEESFLQSVMLGDNELHQLSQEYVAKSDEVFVEMEALYAERKSEISLLRVKSKTYYQLALATSRQIIRDGPGGSGGQVAEMNQSLSELKTALKHFRDSTYERFLQTTDQLQRSISQGLYLGVTLGVMNLCFMGVLVYNISMNMKMMHVIAEQNNQLEHRVAERTHALMKANQQLRTTLDTLNRARDELVRSEKMAALGALVAGVAHELNTPIGNALMVATSLSDKTAAFVSACESGLKKSVLFDFTEQSMQGNHMLVVNLQRAAELIASFKQIAVDRSGSQRRRFDLRETCNEIGLALTPVLKNTSHQLINEIPSGLVLDGYPGPIGQILINFVNNSLAHAFEQRDAGMMRFFVKDVTESSVTLCYADNGCGIAESILPMIFDPFFTTRLGQGGSGLGLNIVHNLVTGVLGGSIQVQSTQGEGTEFCITIPLRAPEKDVT